MPTTGGIQVKTSGAKPFEERCDALVLFVPQKNHEYFEVFRKVDQKTKQALSTLLKSERFVGKIGESITYHTTQSLAPRRIILTGLGELKSINEEMFRRAAGVAALTARRSASSRVAYTVPGELNIQQERLLQAIVEGALLGSYRYIKFKTKEEEIEPEKKVESITVLTEPNSLSRNAIKRAQIMAEATCFARDLVNEPANNLNPASLAQIAKEVAREKGLTIRILEAPELERLGAGAILGVGSGSSVPPRLIQLTYRSGDKKRPARTALVGKGITFDSGGLSLKTAKNMETMKCDMAGAAAVLSTMRALPEIQPDQDVIGILCAAENMPSGSAIRPGDVLKAMNGKSIEIINTDAEGRLVLADGLSWAVKQGAQEIIDLATLTGACVIGLGPHIAGIMGNDPQLIERVREAGRLAGEPIWELPIPRTDYDFMVKSDIADIKNLAQNSEAGAIQGALFLREFIGDAKWAHLDIAGPAFLDREFFHLPKNATGFGVRTLLQYLS